MALSLGDVFLNFTAGAVERNNQIRDENVALSPQSLIYMHHAIPSSQFFSFFLCREKP